MPRSTTRAPQLYCEINVAAALAWLEVPCLRDRRSSPLFSKITTSDPGKYNVLVVATRKDKAAVEAWKGVEVLKTKEEKINYQNQLKYQK